MINLATKLSRTTIMETTNMRLLVQLTEKAFGFDIPWLPTSVDTSSDIERKIKQREDAEAELSHYLVTLWTNRDGIQQEAQLLKYGKAVCEEGWLRYSIIRAADPNLLDQIRPAQA